MSIVLVGSTSGSITLQEPAVAGTTVLDLPATSGNVVVDSATQTLTNKSIAATQLTGTIAVARLPAGSVLQVVQSVKTADQTTTSLSYVDVTDLSVSITPTSSSSKIFVMVSINNICNSGGNITYFNLLRGATTITSNSSGGLSDTNNAWGTGGGGGMSPNDNRKINSCSLNYLDSPATTSSTTYKIQMMVGGDTGSINRWALNTDLASVSSITVMEIAA